MRVFEQGSRPRIGIIFMIGIAGFVVASIGLALSVIYVQGAKIRQTERIIYTQGSALASAYRTVLQLHTQDSASLDAYGKELTNTFEQTQTSSKTNFQLPERHTALSRFGDPVHPPLADPVAGKPADHVALDVGKTLLPSLVKAENVTNSTIHITDYNGVVVASNTLDTGLLLSDEIGVQRALNGDHLSFMRQMSVSDDSRVVFTAVPIVQNNRLLGTVVLTRAPPNPIADLFGNTTDTKSYYHYGSRVSRYIILTFIVIIGGALLFVLAITRPIRRLIRQTQQITAGSRITDIQVPLFAAREIDDLRTAITNMDEALTQIYGMDRLGLMNSWRAALGAAPYIPPNIAESKPTAVTYPTVEAFTLTPKPGGITVSDSDNIDAEEINPVATNGSCNSPMSSNRGDLGIFSMLLFVTALSVRKSICKSKN